MCVCVCVLGGGGGGGGIAHFLKVSSKAFQICEHYLRDQWIFPVKAP